MSYEVSEKRIASQLRVLAKIGTIVPAEHREGVLVDGRVYKAKTIRRYADRIVEYCEKNGIEDCPVRKEYLQNGKNGMKRVKIIVDPVKAEELLKRLEDNNKGDRNGWELESGGMTPIREELEEIKQQLGRIEELIRNTQLKLEERQGGHSLGDIIRGLLNRESYEYMECVRDFAEGKDVDDWCKLAIIVIDKATDVVEKGKAPTTVYVNLYEKMEEEFENRISMLKRMLRDIIKDSAC